MKKHLLLFIAFAILPLLWMRASNNDYDIVVDRAGTGHFRTVQQAIDSVRAFDPAGSITIFIKDGVYKEKLEVYSYLTNVKLLGESKENTIITYDDHANIDNMGTFRTYTLIIRGNNIQLENLTIENNAKQLGQAVALHVEGDRISFKNCRFIGNQDTMYTGGKGARLYFESCYIEGTTDFIFGQSTCWFENCILHSKRKSYITAASTPQDVEYGYIFNNCILTVADDVDLVYLGRPWRAYAMTLFMNCKMDKKIRAEGWHNWNNPDNELTARYMEYNNTGEGGDTKYRVKWSKKLTTIEAEKYTLSNAMKGCDGWNPKL